MWRKTRRPEAERVDLLRKMAELSRRAENPLLDCRLDVDPSSIITNLPGSSLTFGNSLPIEISRGEVVAVHLVWSPGSRIPKHYHALENTHIFVLSGSLRVNKYVGREALSSTLSPSTPYHTIAKGTLYDLEALRESSFLLTFEPCQAEVSTT